MSDVEESWAQVRSRLRVGDVLTATVTGVERWGLMLDIGAPVHGFVDGGVVGQGIDDGRFTPGMELEVVIWDLVDRDRQVRFHLTDAQLIRFGSAGGAVSRYEAPPIVRRQLPLVVERPFSLQTSGHPIGVCCCAAR